MRSGNSSGRHKQHGIQATPEVAQTKERRIPALDGLRALAILAVIVCHVNWAVGGPFYGGRISGSLSALFGWGWIGVDLFFVLSGFLITGILYDAKSGSRYFRNFYGRRILRIMPLYFGFLCLMVVLSRLQFSRISWLSGEDLLALGTYTYNLQLSFTERLIPGMHHFWSLALEEHFYLLWPVAVCLLNHRGLMRLCVLGAVASFALRIVVVFSGAWPMTAFFFTPCRLDGLLAGSFVALVWRDKRLWQRWKRIAPSLVLCSGSLLLGIALGQRHFLPDVTSRQVGTEAAVDGKLVITAGISLLAVLFAGLLTVSLTATQGSRWRHFLERPSLGAIGRYSYAMYVFHVLIITLTVNSGLPLWWLPVPIAKPLLVFWITLASFGVAWLSFHLYEKHFLRLKRFFDYNRSNPRPTEAAVPQQSFVNA